MLGEPLQRQVELALVAEDRPLRRQRAGHAGRIADGSAQLLLLAHHRERTGGVAALAQDLGTVAEADLQPVGVARLAAQRLLAGEQRERLVGLAAIAQTEREVAERGTQHDRLAARLGQRHGLAERRLAADEIALQHQRPAEVDERGRQPSLADLAGLAVLVDEEPVQPQRLRRDTRHR